MGKFLLLSLIVLGGCTWTPGKTQTTAPIDLVNRPVDSKAAIDQLLLTGVCKAWKTRTYQWPGDTIETVREIQDNNADRAAFGCKN